MRAFKRIVGSIGCIAAVSVALACGEDIGSSTEEATEPGEAAVEAVEAEAMGGEPNEPAEDSVEAGQMGGEPGEGDYIVCYLESPERNWTIELGDGVWGLQGWPWGTAICLGPYRPRVEAPLTVVAGAGAGVLTLVVLMGALCVNNSRKGRASKR